MPWLIAPDPDAPRLTRAVAGVDHEGRAVETRVVEERPLTIFLNSQEIVTAMTIGDYPEHLAAGYLLNQGMLRRDDTITAIDHDPELETVVVRTARATDYEAKLRKKTRTSGCAVGTVFGDVMEGLEGLALPPTPVRTSDLYALARIINTTPSLYLAAGAIHGTVLCQGAQPLVYMEDVGRHNAVDKIAGWMHLNAVPADTPFFPADLAARLQAAGPFAMAATPGDPAPERHPTFALWPVALRHDLRAALEAGLRKVVAFTDPHGCATVLFPDADAFFNVNTPEDLARAEALAAP
jgi:formate dehydrogenase accessory protein FdhD